MRGDGALQDATNLSGRRRDLRCGVRRVRNTGHIGKRHRPHHWRQPLRPLFIHPRLPERL